MNKMFYKSLLGIVLLGNIFSAQTLKKKSKKEEIRYRYAYLEMNGIFEMDSKDSLTVNDSRNPSKIILSTTDKPGTLTKMTFFHHDDKTNQTHSIFLILQKLLFGIFLKTWKIIQENVRSLSM